MRRRSRAGGEKTKTRRRKTVTLKRRNGPKVARHRGSSAAGLNKKVALFKRERDEALEQQRATSEVLRAISNSPTDAASTLGAIAESVARLLGVADAEIMSVEGNVLRCVAKHGSSRQWPWPLASFAAFPRFGRYRSIADISLHCRELARSRLTLSGHEGLKIVAVQPDPWNEGEDKRSIKWN
jgi:hypothetical protein